MIECDNNEEFIIANLSSSVFNETLDLAFNEGEKICFKVDGPGTVHLTGNLMDEDNLSPSGEDFSMLAGSDSEMESDEEEAGEKIQEVIEKTGKRKKVEAVKNQEVVAKKAKVDAEEESEESEDGDDDDESGEEETTDADTTANATTGDDDDDSDDSDEDDSEEEDSKEVEGAKPKQKKEEESKAKKAEAVKEDDEDEDSDSDEEDDSDDEEEEEPKAAIPPTEPKEAPGAEPKLVKKKEVKGKAVAAAATPNVKSKAEDPKAEAKTPISEAKTSKAGTKTPKADVQTPKAEAKTSKTDAKTPKAEAKTPNAEAKTPKADAKTPKADAKTPKADAKTAKGEAKTPKTDAKTPKAETKSEDKAPKTPKEKAAKDAAATPGKTPKRTLKGGVQVEELKEGSGSEVKVGNMVGMHYAGKLSSNNKQFDACSSPQKPFKFKIGTGQVIRGWDVGVLGMKVGGKRRLTIPAAMAYGKEGSQPDIPPNAPLVFDVDCKFVK